MPWHVIKSGSCPASKPWAVVKGHTGVDGPVVACHPSRDSAIQQLKALYASEPDARVTDSPEFWQGAPVGFICPHCDSEDAPNEAGDCPGCGRNRDRNVRSPATPPPHLRRSHDPSKRCDTCKMFDSGVCWGYGNYPVKADEVCDSWAPEKDSRLSNIAVVSEPRTYDKRSHSSFFRDQMDMIVLGDHNARRRLERHEREVQTEVELRSTEGARVVRQRMVHLREQRRELSISELEHEARAATSSTISGFTTPQWIISEYAIARSTQRTFADQCRSLPLPDVGLQLNVPRFTVDASAGVQLEGSVVSEVDPSGTVNSENVQTIAAQITASQQLLDRTRNMPDGPAFDMVLYEQLKDDYDQSVNNYAIGKATGVGATVAGTAAFGATNPVAALYLDVASAREKITDTAGVHLQPTHLFTTPDLFSYMTKQLDSQNRPIIVPSLAPGVPPGPIAAQDGDNEEAYKWVQFTGTAVPGLLFWFIDATLPPSGSAGTVSPIIVSRPDRIILWESEPIVRVYPQTLANNLQCVVTFYAYTCCIPRTAGATATILGNAYQTNLS